ncbi:MAG: DUF6183 family protein [Minicystis sp.]
MAACSASSSTSPARSARSSRRSSAPSALPNTRALSAASPRRSQRSVPCRSWWTPWSSAGAIRRRAILLARWTQESCLRGKPVDEAREVRAFWSGLDHPLAVLPLRLAPVERGLGRWVWRFDRSGGSSRSTPPPPVHVAHHRGEPGAEILAGERDLDAEAVLERIGLAPATVYVTSSPLAGHHPDRRLLFDLGLESLAETARRRVRHHRITPADAIERLFSVAHGVMRGSHDADVRLETWQSVAALLGGPLEAAMDRAAASDWSWVTGFVPRDRVSLGELGLLVIAPERTRVGAVTTWLTD